MPDPLVRPGSAGDLDSIAAIQARSPESAQWDPPSYLRYDLRVASCGGRVEGFLVSRTLAPGEAEILNLGVSPEFRRRGIGRTLLESLLEGWQGDVFLEVRASNQTAISFYKSLGFEELSSRPGYYQSPLEAAIVMKFHSC